MPERKQCGCISGHKCAIRVSNGHSNILCAFVCRCKIILPKYSIH